MKRFLSLLLILCMIPAIPGANAAGRFADVSDAGTARAADLLSNLGIIAGDGSGNYRPDTTFNRAMLAVIAVRLAGVTDVSSYKGSVRFPDVRAGHWAHPWVMAAVEMGIMTGGSDGNYNPSGLMNYGYLATVLMRLLGYEDKDVGLNWPQSYIAKAEALGLSKGMKFQAKDVLTKGQTARLIYNFLFMQFKEGGVYIEKTFGTAYVEMLLSFGLSGGVTVIYAPDDPDKNYTYAGVLEESLQNKLATLLVDKDGRVLSLETDPKAVYKTVTVKAGQSRGLELTDGSFLPVPSSAVVFDWDGSSDSYAAYAGKAKEFLEEEPVSLIFRGDTLLYIMRDSDENKVGARPKDLLLYLKTVDGKLYAFDYETGDRYPVTGTIDQSLQGHTGRLMVDRDGNAVSFTDSKDYKYQTVTVAEPTRINGIVPEGGGLIAISPDTPIMYDAGSVRYKDAWLDDISVGESFLLAYKGAGALQYMFPYSIRSAGGYALAVLDSQPLDGRNPLPELFGKNAENAVIYKNGYKASPDMLERWDVLQYYESSNTVEACSVKLVGYFDSPSPNPGAPSSFTVMGRTFDLLPEATQKVADHPVGQRWTYLLSADGRIADIRTTSEVPDTVMGVVTKWGVYIDKNISFSGSVTGAGPIYGKVCNIRGTTAGISATPVNVGGSVTKPLDLLAMTLGDAPVAPWCAFFDQVNDGQAARVSLSDIPVTYVPASKILRADISSSGYVTAIILNGVTAEPYTYGFFDSSVKSDGYWDENEGKYVVTDSYTDVSVNDGTSELTDWLFAGDRELPVKGQIAGISAGYAVNGDPILIDLITCKKYDNITRFDFEGNTAVTLGNNLVPLAAGLKVYVPYLGYYMDVADARAYCSSFEVYTDPWGYKARFIIGRT